MRHVIDMGALESEGLFYPRVTGTRKSLFKEMPLENEIKYDSEELRNVYWRNQNRGQGRTEQNEVRKVVSRFWSYLWPW